MKILILGGTGMLGSDCKKILSEKNEIIILNKQELDIISWDGVIGAIDKVSPDVILNCVGFTDIDACETENYAVRKINIEGPRNLAQGCARFQCKLVHISSGCIFDGRKLIPQPYFEDDALNPQSAYGISKMESETAVRQNSPNYIIIRTAWLYGITGISFLKSVVKHAVQKESEVLKVADDQFGSPTWSYRLALQIEALLQINARGTYHATAEGCCSQFEYAGFILDKLGLKCRVEPHKMKDLNYRAKRPTNCLLENRLLKKQGINVMPHWKEDLNIFLDKYGEEVIKDAKLQQLVDVLL